MTLAAGGTEEDAREANAGIDEDDEDANRFRLEEAAIAHERRRLVSTIRALKLPRRPYRDVWWVFLITAVLGILPRYIYQFTVFHNGRFWPEGDKGITDMLGFPVIPHSHSDNGTELPYPNAISDSHGPEFVDGVWSHVLGAPMLLLAFAI
jgi:hypothetical protein